MGLPLIKFQTRSQQSSVQLLLVYPDLLKTWAVVNSGDQAEYRATCVIRDQCSLPPGPDNDPPDPDGQEPNPGLAGHVENKTVNLLYIPWSNQGVLIHYIYTRCCWFKHKCEIPKDVGRAITNSLGDSQVYAHMFLPLSLFMSKSRISCYRGWCWAWFSWRDGCALCQGNYMVISSLLDYAL